MKHSGRIDATAIADERIMQKLRDSSIKIDERRASVYGKSLNGQRCDL